MAEPGEEVIKRPSNELENRSEDIDRLRKDLGGFWSLNWGVILGSLEAINPTAEQREELAILAIKYMEQAFKTGQFRNLIGIEPVLKFLGVDNIGFTETHLKNIIELSAKYPLPFLYSMSPNLIDGRLHDGREYDKIGYVRELLVGQGATPAELTDEYIQNLWDARETLIKLHNNKKVNPSALSQGMKLIEFTHLLED